MTNQFFCLLKEVPGQGSALDGLGRITLKNRGNSLENVEIISREPGEYTEENYCVSLDVRGLIPSFRASYAAEDESTGFQMSSGVTVSNIVEEQTTVERDSPFGDGETKTYPYISLQYADPDSPNVQCCREYSGSRTKPESVTIHFLALLDTNDLAEAIYRPTAAEQNSILKSVKEWKWRN